MLDVTKVLLYGTVESSRNQIPDARTCVNSPKNSEGHATAVSTSRPVEDNGWGKGGRDEGGL